MKIFIMKQLKILFYLLLVSFYSKGQITVSSSSIIPADLEITSTGTLYNTASIPLIPSKMDEWTTISSKANGDLLKVGIYDYDSIYIEQTGVSTWTKYIRFNADSTWTSIRDVEVDASGNVYLIGSVLDSIIFSPTDKYDYNTEGLILIKIDNSGIYQWHKYIAGAKGYDIEIDDNDDIIALGRDSDNSLLMSRYNSAGTKLGSLPSSATIGGLCNGRRVVFDGADFYVTGKFYDTITLGVDTLYTSSEGMFIAKIKGDLSKAYWTDYSYYPGAESYGADIELDNCNYPVAAGIWRSGVDAKMWVFRYHPDGTWLGSFEYNGSTAYKYSEITAMEIEPATGTIHFAGHLADNVYPNNHRRGYTAVLDTCLLSATATAANYSTSYSSVPIALTGYPSGGVFSGIGVTGNEFDPEVAGAGNHKVYYTFTGCNCSAIDSITIDVDCYPKDNFSEYVNIHQNIAQNYPHFKRIESDYFIDSIPNQESGTPIPVQRVITVNTTQDNGGDIYISLAEDNGEVLWTKRYGGSDLDRGTSVKKCNSGFIVAGTTLSYGSNKLKPFILRLNSDGSINWFKVYEISNHVLSVNVVELNNGDIAMTGFYNAHEYAGQTHDFFTLVTNSNGNLLSFKQLGKANRNWEYMRDIEPTSDGGYVMVGNGGHNNDYHAGVIMKFDNSYNVQWATEIRRVLGGGTYNLGSAGQRSNTFFTAVEETSSGDFIMVGRVSDHDGSGRNATFKHGVIVKVDNNGNFLANKMFNKTGVDFLLLHNFDITASGDIVIIGKTRDVSTNNELTSLFSINNAWALNSLSVEYNFETRNEGLCVWEAPDGGYTLTGLTGATGVSKKRYILNTDNGGGSINSIICDHALPLADYSDLMEGFSYTWQETTPVHFENDYTLSSTDLCVLLRDCSDTGIPDGRQKWSDENFMDEEWLDVEPISELILDTPLKIYPNPANGTLYFAETVSEVMILDMAGRLVLKVENETIDQLSINTIPKGIHIVKAKKSVNSVIQSSSLIIE